MFYITCFLSILICVITQRDVSLYCCITWILFCMQIMWITFESTSLILRSYAVPMWDIYSYNPMPNCQGLARMHTYCTCCTACCIGGTLLMLLKIPNTIQTIELFYPRLYRTASMNMCMDDKSSMSKYGVNK